MSQSETGERILATEDNGLVVAVKIATVDRPSHVNKVDVLVHVIQGDTDSLQNVNHSWIDDIMAQLMIMGHTSCRCRVKMSNLGAADTLLSLLLPT